MSDILCACETDQCLLLCILRHLQDNWILRFLALAEVLKRPTSVRKEHVMEVVMNGQVYGHGSEGVRDARL